MNSYINTTAISTLYAVCFYKLGTVIYNGLWYVINGVTLEKKDTYITVHYPHSPPPPAK